jgi:hypothetical protein
MAASLVFRATPFVEALSGDEHAFYREGWLAIGATCGWSLKNSGRGCGAPLVSIDLVVVDLTRIAHWHASTTAMRPGFVVSLPIEFLA